MSLYLWLVSGIYAFNCTAMTQWRLTFPLCFVFVPASGELLTFCRPTAIPTNAYHNNDMLCSIRWVPGLDLSKNQCILAGTPPPWQTNHGQLCYHEICTLLHTPTPTPTANYPQPPPGHSSAPLCFSREKKEGEGKNTPTAIFFSHLSGVKTTPWPYTAQVVRGSLKSNQETTDGKTDKLQGRKKRSNQLAPIIVDDNL